MEWIKWIIIAGVAVIQILEMVRSDRSHKAEVAAKDAALSAKDSLIETLRELTSVQVREHYVATKAQLEDYIEQLKGQLDTVTKDRDGIKVAIQANLDKAQHELRATEAMLIAQIDTMKRRALQRPNRLFPAALNNSSHIYTQVSFGELLEEVLEDMRTEFGISFDRYPNPAMFTTWQRGEWLYQDMNDFSVRVFRWKQNDKGEALVAGPNWDDLSETRDEFETRFRSDFKTAIHGLNS